jgi:hypothetical protein
MSQSLGQHLVALAVEDCERKANVQVGGPDVLRGERHEVPVTLVELVQRVGSFRVLR